MALTSTALVYPSEGAAGPPGPPGPAGPPGPGGSTAYGGIAQNAPFTNDNTGGPGVYQQPADTALATFTLFTTLGAAPSVEIGVGEAGDYLVNWFATAESLAGYSANLAYAVGIQPLVGPIVFPVQLGSGERIAPSRWRTCSAHALITLADRDRLSLHLITFAAGGTINTVNYALNVTRVRP